MNFRTMVIKTVFGVFAEQKHGCQRRNTDFINGFSGDKNRIDVHNRLFARRNDKGVSTGNAGAVQQRINGDALVAAFGTLNPEFAENREFLAGLNCGVNRQPASRKAVFLLFAQCPEVAGAEKRDQLVIISGTV